MNKTLDIIVKDVISVADKLANRVIKTLKDVKKKVFKVTKKLVSLIVRQIKKRKITLPRPPSKVDKLKPKALIK